MSRNYKKITSSVRGDFNGYTVFVLKGSRLRVESETRMSTSTPPASAL